MRIDELRIDQIRWILLSPLERAIAAKRQRALTGHIEIGFSMHNHLSSSTRALFQIHFCVFLWGFTAILGKAITFSALPLVWWRMLLVTSALMLAPGFWKGLA